MKDLYICRACWLIATPKGVTKGSSLIEAVLWCLFIIPGVFYSVWRLITRERVCPLCSSLAVIPINSFMGQKLFNEINSNRNTQVRQSQSNCQRYDFVKEDHMGHEGQYQGRKNWTLKWPAFTRDSLYRISISIAVFVLALGTYINAHSI